MIKKTICFSNRAYLSLRQAQMVIRRENGKGETEELTRPIEDLGVVIIENPQVTISAALISALLENNVAVVSCDKHFMPVGMLMPLVGNTVQSERYNSQIIASQPLKKQLWQQTVSAKIRNQALSLSISSKAENGNMLAWSKGVRSGDPENLDARAAAYYWKNFFPAIPDFKRDRYGDFPNPLLNYGYAILRSVIARSLVGSGLLPTFGIFHRNKYNAFCLADDIMEPYRPFVDLMVLQILKDFPDLDEVSKEAKLKLLTIPVMDVKIGRLKRPLMIAASMTTASLAECFLGNSRKISYPEIMIR